MNLIGSNLRTVVAALVLSVAAAAPSVAGDTDSAVRAAVAANETVRVILQFATTAQRDAAATRLTQGGAIVRVLNASDGAPALVAYGQAALFANEGNATNLSLDAGVSVLSSRFPHSTSAWRRNVQRRVSATRQFSTSRNSYTVAVIDSGIVPQPDLPLSRIRAYKNFVGDANPLADVTPVDGCGHGTHVAGIVAGNGARSNGDYAGIAPNLDIVSLRVLGDDCSGNTSDVIEALNWVGENYQFYKIKVVNLSLGHAVLASIFEDPLVEAVERLSRKGVVVVTAAGNKGINPLTNKPGYGGVGVPCNAPSSVCVGSLDTKATSRFADDRVADSSSRGPTRFDLLAKPDMVAPGVNIVSLAAPGSRLATEFSQLCVAGRHGSCDYFTLSGTSMASPAVAGAAALILNGNAQLPVHAVKLSLQFTARRLKQADVLTQGAGALNIPGAITLSSSINPNVRRGRNWITRQLTAANYDASGQKILWSQRIIYGDRFVQPRYVQINLFRWSNDLVWGYDAIEDNIVWGNDDDNIVWGNDDNIVWGNEDNIVWGNDDNIVWGNFEDDNIVWGNNETAQQVWGIDDNIVWGNDDNIVWGNDDNIVWGNDDNIVWGNDDNIVWGNSYVRGWAKYVVWGFWDDNIVWGNVTRANEDNIVWGNNDDNIVWGNCSEANDDNIVWGNDDNIVWGNDDNIVWGNCGDDNIVWGNDDDNIVWGNSVLTGGRR